MIGYENNTSHPAYRRFADDADREAAIDLRAEEIAKDIEALPYEADDLYYAIDRLSDHERTKLARLIERIEHDGFATLRAAMDAMRERRAEEQGERIAREEMDR